MTSIRRRLVVGLALGVTFIWLVGAALSARTVAHELDEVFDESLREGARRVLALVARDFASSVRPAATAAAAATDGDPLEGDGDYRESLLSYVVRDDEGRVVMLSRGASESGFPEDAPDGFSRDDDYRYYAESTADGRLWIQASDPLWHRREATEEAVLAIATLLPVLLALSVALGVFLTRHALAGVHEMRTELEGRGGRNLEPLSRDTVPLELHPAVDAVNRMLERLGGALEAERGVASGTAHELRTPIATALAQTQRLVATLPDGASRERARGIATTLGDLGRLAEKLVQLGRAESGFMDTGERRDGADVIPLVLDEFHGRDAAAARLRYRVVGEPRFESRLDPDGLAIVLRNLVENALKHGRVDAPVDVILDGTANSLTVVNDVDGPTPDAPERLRARFARGATTAPGTGLGLAIVDAILRGTDLTLELLAPPPGRTRGFAARLAGEAARQCER